MLADAIAQLPAALRDVCLLRNLSELSIQEVATHLGISTIAVRLRLFRAQRRLKNDVSGISLRRLQQQTDRSGGRAASRRSKFCVPCSAASRDSAKQNALIGNNEIRKRPILG